MKKKLRAGFTFAETLITVLLMSIVFTAISGGFIVFQRVYSDVTRKANAQVMLSTAIMEITNDLKGAETYYTQGNAFYTTSRGYAIRYVGYTQDSKLTAVSAAPYLDSGLQSIPLLTSKTNTDGMFADVASLSYNSTKNIFTFTVDIRLVNSPDTIIESQNLIVRPNQDSLDVEN